MRGSRDVLMSCSRGGAPLVFADCFILGGRPVLRILYVEDNDDNVFMLKMRLELC